MESGRYDNTLFVTTEDDTELEIRVIDIVKKRKGLKKKEFIFYVLAENPFDIYASYLDERRESYTLATIEDSEDEAFVNKYIEDLPIETIIEMARGDVPADEFVDMWVAHYENEED